MSDPSPRAKVRAVLLAIVIAIHGLYAAPIPHVVTPAELENPVSRDEVATWADRLTALGYTIDAETLGDRVVEISGWIGGTHRAAKRPFRRWMRSTGTGQGWALFANPDTHPGRFGIRVTRDTGGVEDLYLQLHPDLDWWRRPLSYRRLRGCWDAGGFGPRPRSIYRRFAHWIAGRIFAEQPDVTLVEIRTLRTHTTLPGEPVDDTVDVRHVIRVHR